MFSYLWKAFNTPSMFRSGPEQLSIGLFCLAVWGIGIVLWACWKVWQDEQRLKAKLAAKQKGKK